MSEDLARLREEIAGLDRALLELLERRFGLAADVGRIKAEQGRPIVVQEVEQRVLSRAREAAELCGVSPGVMEAIFAAIIQGAVERQHRVGIKRRARGGARVLVLGAAGAMGGWLRRFLESIGHTTEGVDTAWSGLPPAKGRYPSMAGVQDPEGFDAVIVSVPLEATADVLSSLAENPVVNAPIFEIASIKSHLEEPMAALRKSGLQAISIHPMFGPGKNPFEPITVVHASAGDEAGERAAILDLLAHPYLDLVSLPFEHHDRLMGWLLGLAHLTGMLFADALSMSGLDPKELERVASTTFARQVSTASSVLDEDPELYYAIQRLNPFRGEVYDALHAALNGLTGAVEGEEREAFATRLARAASVLPKL
jgi:prephenate dehydrogenase/chorismate mutase